MRTATNKTVQLRLAAGELWITGWPVGGPALPFGLRADAATGGHRGPARLRAEVLRLAGSAGLAAADPLTLVALGLLAPPALSPPDQVGFAAWQQSDRRGVIAGAPAVSRVAFALAALAAVGRSALLVVPHTAAIDAWRRALGPVLGERVAEHRPRRVGPPVQVATIVAAAWEVPRQSLPHELLLLDGIEAMPAAALQVLGDGSAAAARLAFAAEVDARALTWPLRFGPVVQHRHGARGPAPPLRILLPLTADERNAYEDAFASFFGAYDHFAAMAPGAQFGEFVRWARSDPGGRPGLLAWHRALAVLAWTRAKSAAVAAILAAHADARVLLFTADKQSTYALARAHLVAPVTGELPRRERQQVLAAFQRGELRALVGPRLLDDGVPEASAAVGVVVGSAFGAGQRRARARRIKADGVVYELLSQDTMEVGRARREVAAARTPAALD